MTLRMSEAEYRELIGWHPVPRPEWVEWSDPIRPVDTDDEPWPIYPNPAPGAWLTGALLVAAALVAVLVVRRIAK